MAQAAKVSLCLLFFSESSNLTEMFLNQNAGQKGRVIDDEMQIDDASNSQQSPTLMPTGDEMFRLLKALDLSYKTEMIFVSKKQSTSKVNSFIFTLVPIARHHILVQYSRRHPVGVPFVRIFRGAQRFVGSLVPHRSPS